MKYAEPIGFSIRSGTHDFRLHIFVGDNDAGVDNTPDLRLVGVYLFEG